MSEPFLLLKLLRLPFFPLAQTWKILEIVVTCKEQPVLARICCNILMLLWAS